MLGVPALLVSCDVNKSIDAVSKKAVADLGVDSGDLVVIGSDFSRAGEPVVGFEVQNSRVPPDLMNLIDQSDGVSVTDEIRRCNHYLEAIGCKKIGSNEVIDGVSVKYEGTYSYVLVHRSEVVLILYLGGV